MSQRITKINDLKQLRFLLAQDEEGLNKFVYDKLSVGDIWWIPDKVTKFGEREQHPWVVITDYAPHRPPILACPRSTKLTNQSRNLKTPANVLPALDRDGELIWRAKRSFPAHQFRDYEYIGRLPEVWIQEVNKWVRRMTGANPNG